MEIILLLIVSIVLLGTPTCSERKFNACYVDQTLFGDVPYDVMRHCHGIHSGDQSYPCTNIFALNFGGAMREVSCEEFMEALKRKQQQCMGCLKAIGQSPINLLNSF